MSLYDVTSCLAACSHVPFGVSEGLCLRGLCPKGLCPWVAVNGMGVSLWGSPSGGSLSMGWGSPSGGSLSREVYVWGSPSGGSQ